MASVDDAEAPRAATPPAGEPRPRRRPVANPLLRPDAGPADGGFGDVDDPFGRAVPFGVAASADMPGAGATNPGRGARRAIPVTASASPGMHAECYACPVGSAFAAVRGAPPETLDHLLAASREFVAAIRSAMEVVEHTLDRPVRGGAGRGRRSRVQRVTLD